MGPYRTIALMSATDNLIVFAARDFFSDASSIARRFDFMRCFFAVAFLLAARRLCVRSVNAHVASFDLGMSRLRCCLTAS
jgi:hypothetical protein